MANKYQSTKSGRQIDRAVEITEKLPAQIEDILNEIKILQENQIDKDLIPQKLSDLINDITDQTYNSSSEKPQSGKAVAEAIANLLGTAPENLDTLEELAKALNEDENFAAKVIAELTNKVDKVDGKGLSTNDFTDEYKKQLDDGINIDVDTELSETSENPVANKVVTAELKKKVTAVNGKDLSANDYTDEDKEKLNNIEDGANKTIVDSELSEASTNPVQNKVTLEALNGKADSIINSDSGENIKLTDSAEAKLRGLKLYGKTTQDGIPTLDTPIELNSIGNDGNVDVTITDEENNSQTFIVSTPNGLKGIPCSSGGNYTDENGQRWFCDEVDFEREVRLQRIQKIVFDGSNDEAWTIQSTNEYGIVNFFTYVIGKHSTLNGGYCDKLSRQTTPIMGTSTEGFYLVYDVLYIRLNEERAATVEDLRAFLTDNPITCIYALAEPVTTPLTEEEIEAYKALTMYKPVTNIFNSDNAHMEVDYVADTKTYIDNKFAQLQALILEG